MPSTFTVFFDGSLWVGVLEISDPAGVRAARHVFGPEPSNAELAEFVRRGFDRLLERALAAPPVPADRRPPPRRPNPKRAARRVAREQAARPLTTAAQDALREAYEQVKSESRAAARRRRAEESAARRAIGRSKARARRRGR